jgi:hypothetical protein
MILQYQHVHVILHSDKAIYNYDSTIPTHPSDSASDKATYNISGMMLNAVNRGLTI